jgi:hypothetical protein
MDCCSPKVNCGINRDKACFNQREHYEGNKEDDGCQYCISVFTNQCFIQDGSFLKAKRVDLEPIREARKESGT